MSDITLNISVKIVSNKTSEKKYICDSIHNNAPFISKFLVFFVNCA